MLAGGFDQYLGIGQSYVAEVYDSTMRSFSPLPIKGLDSSPVHAYAIEGIKEFSED